jgi:hypothetical protein
VTTQTVQRTSCGRSGLLVGALDWIETNLAAFDPLTDGIKPDALRNKALAELAFMCDYLCRARPMECARSRRILSFVARIWQRAEYQDLIVRDPESLQLYALTYGSLRNAGFDVASSAPMIQGVVDAGYSLAVEVVPFRKMDLRHVLDHAGIRHALAPMVDSLARTMLAQRPPLYYLTSADVYCLTHTIFYVTDFGFGPVDVMESDALDAYRHMVEQLLGLYVRLRDWDLTAELLICTHCLKSAASEVQSAAVQALTAAQLDDGSVPAPRFDPEGEDARRAGTNYAFEHNYHTTLVAALAAVLCP